MTDQLSYFRIIRVVIIFHHPLKNLRNQDHIFPFDIVAPLDQSQYFRPKQSTQYPVFEQILT